ncbi:MAG: endonuclease domain-containing protein [Brevundimonas sp.]|uniref:endonuclease domain-containing protein n=1 Tax=Brevundimonas sp. TaxID=1871086 RepID=UPI00248926E2|nr:endonuclease domain-containing protein [Brevundimonas sp.]MDI1326745.1 endonuclease domain-containing protein [Brevundimonas sp.]
MHQSPDRTRRARRLRSDMTGAEDILWEMLRGRRFEDLKFRRQAPVAGFVVDFLCPDLRLVIELDGGVHDLREAEDAARDERIRLAGYTVLRFRNNAFTTNPNLVLDAIRQHAHLPSPLGGEGVSRRETDEGYIAAKPPSPSTHPVSPHHPPHPSGSAAHLLPQGEKGEKA